jgi:hypothetical protein
LDEISEEGFGYFRGTWWIGRVLIRDALRLIREESELIRLIDDLASTPEEFESLAAAIEAQDLGPLPDELRASLAASDLISTITDEEAAPLDGLEVGVAGLTYALSASRCLTAASCRSHVGTHSWADYPVVLFAAPEWRIEILAELAASEGCGIEPGRDMAAIYSRSITELHSLAELIVNERGRFRRVPDHHRHYPDVRRQPREQLRLFPRD